MKLIIDRGMTIKNIYTIEFGVDFDVMIFKSSIVMNTISKDILAEADKIITKTSEMKYCVMYMKHPLLLNSYAKTEETTPKFWMSSGDSLKQILRSYFAIRLKHRRYPVELYELGKRFFK